MASAAHESSFCFKEHCRRDRSGSGALVKLPDELHGINAKDSQHREELDHIDAPVPALNLGHERGWKVEPSTDLALAQSRRCPDFDQPSAKLVIGDRLDWF